MPAPTGMQVFAYDPVDTPVLSSNPAEAEPIGSGPAATGGDTLSIQIQAEFSDPVNVSLSIYAPSVDNLDLYFMDPSNSLQPISQGIAESETPGSMATADRSYNSGHDESGSGGHGSYGMNRAFLRNFVLWKTGITSIDKSMGPIPVSGLPAGVCTLALTVRPSNSGYSHSEDAGNPDYYRWTTYFVVK